ncbi:MAG TPA: peptide ABC transporter substrate-binding protein, partial [Candidatus Eremiobacteraceae bacterium]|nr:peptide ABC transporter substrate-binding protein [Candidatus Eremiobacteraceae bacterium]
PIPDVALAVPTRTNGGISADGLTITYHLRHGVTFSDGVPLTSADAKYTWQQIVNPDNNASSRYPYDDVASVDTPDPYTLIVHLKARLSPFVGYFLRNGTLGSILPKHLLDKYPNLNRIGFNIAPIGSGPFVVENYQPGVRLDLRANPHYWRGPPKLRAIEYHIIPNQQTLLTQVGSHEIDFYFDAPEVQYALLKAIDGVRVTARPNQSFEHISFNCGRPPLDDVRVRQALSYAIDWNRLAQDVYLGLGLQGMADIAPSTWAYDPSVKPYPFDPGRAKALLAEAGWMPGSDGVLAKDGRPLEFTMTTVAGVSSREKVEALVQQDLRHVGVDLHIKNDHANMLFATYGANGTFARGRFDIGLYAWSYTIPDPDDTLTLGPDQVPPAGQNYTFCKDALIGQYQREARTSYDRAVRRAALVKLQHREYEVVPRHTIVWRANIDAVNSDMKNFKPAPAVSDFWNAWEWDI